MSHGLKLTCFFAISVALHGVALWAAAGRFEPHEPEPSAGVAIVDRDLFFRHAARSETQASQPVSTTERIAPVPGPAVRPSQAEASASRAPARAASEPAPERRAPETDTTGAMARLDPSTIESTRPPRRDAAAPEADVDTTPPEPARLAGVAGAPLGAVRSRAQGPAIVARVEPAQTSDGVASASASRLPSATDAAPVSPARTPDRQASAGASQLASAADAARAEPTRAPDRLANADASQLAS
ncbi:MAG: hypothetical protein ACOC71_00005, partial [Hyphomicrobiales bacterium]